MQAHLTNVRSQNREALETLQGPHLGDAQVEAHAQLLHSRPLVHVQVEALRRERRDAACRLCQILGGADICGRLHQVPVLKKVGIQIQMPLSVSCIEVRRAASFARCYGMRIAVSIS